MKKIAVILGMVVIFATCGQAKVNVVTKSLVMYPEKEMGKIVRVVFNTDDKGSFLFVIKDKNGNTVRTLSAGNVPAGQGFVEWDGKDFAGNTVNEGEYSVSIITGISWNIDETFGKNGSIGLETMEVKVTDPEKIIFKSAGEIKKISIGETEYYKTDNLAIAGPNYTVKDGIVQLNPTGGAKKDDVVKVEYYYPSFLENPWALDIDQEGNLYVLYRWQTESMKSPAVNLIKISPDGNRVITDFGSDGKIGPFTFHTSQVIVSEKEGKIYVAGSHDSGHGTGVFSLKTGAPFYSIGGYFGTGNPKTTFTPSGIALGPDTKIYIRFSAYDRTKEKDKGFLYTENPIAKRHSGYPPLIDNYWGPSMESSVPPDCFYASAYQSDIAKIKDTGTGFVELYYLSVPGNPVGMSFDRGTGLLYAALRTTTGEIAVIHDTGISLNELWRLRDKNLGPTHAVKIKGNNLYVIEDGTKPVGRILTGMEKVKIEPQGKNKITKYTLSFTEEKDVCRISVKK
ncbi:MAG TPA: FlgD immunoglobulin-like domain containing protein [bacterium]|nr:FlgD immunoglobulin-like domain containing protein [bacterium]